MSKATCRFLHYVRNHGLCPKPSVPKISMPVTPKISVDNRRSIDKSAHLHPQNEKLHLLPNGNLASPASERQCLDTTVRLRPRLTSASAVALMDCVAPILLLPWSMERMVADVQRVYAPGR